MARRRLSEVQRSALAVVAEAEPPGVNDREIEASSAGCNSRTVSSLAARGLIERDDAGRWIATAAGNTALRGPIQAPRSCAVRTFTADGVSVGRCWHNLEPGDVCPLHGDVSDVMELYRRTGKMTPEWTPGQSWRPRK